MRIACTGCGRDVDQKKMNFLCPDCGGIFDIIHTPALDLGKKEGDSRGVLKYCSYLGLENNEDLVSLGEGGTKIIPDEYQGREIFHKMESQNPTGSYKDRGTVVLINYLKRNHISSVVEDSSGNAGASLAAYAAKANIRAKIFVPDTASGPKRRQIEEFGAELIIVPGPRSNAAKAVRIEAERGVVYASHAYMPMGLLGIATIAFEIYEALGESIRTIIAPVGHGGLMLGIIRGFQALMGAGYISQVPKFIGVQTALVSPVASILNKEKFETGSNLQTIAEGVRVTEPVRGSAVAGFLKMNNGKIIRVEEENILPAFEELALRGVHVEPTSALTWAVLKMLPEEISGPIVLVQTGAGYKYQPS
jgi:threonine synthase